MPANRFLARITPFGNPLWQVFWVTHVDPSLEVGGGPIIPPPGGYPPVDPGYSPPWAQVPPGGGAGPGGPVDPGYSPPWAQIPVDPGYGIPIGGHPGHSPGPGVQAVVIPLPATNPPATPPEGMPAGSAQVLIWFGRGTQPAIAWVQPYASTGPVTPPSGGDTSV